MQLITKRHMLKVTVSHYNGGILSPILVQFKCIIQEAYQDEAVLG